MINLSLIKSSKTTIHRWFCPTPIEYSRELSDLLKLPTIFKCEYLQPSGSFKLRGAFFALSQLTSKQQEKGVSTCGFDNHARALAYAAEILNIPCTLYLTTRPSSDIEKKLKQRYLSLKISPFDSLELTVKWAEEDSLQKGIHFISSFDSRVIAANGGSLGIEILKDVPQAKNVIIPLDEGDMFLGLSHYLKSKFPDIRIIGAKQDHDPYPSLLRRYNKSPDLMTSHSEAEVFEALQWMVEHHRCLIEPSSATAVAACLTQSLSLLEGPTVIVLSGKNFTPATFQRLIERLKS